MKNTKRGTPDPQSWKKKTLMYPQVTKKIKPFAATCWRKKVFNIWTSSTRRLIVLSRSLIVNWCGASLAFSALISHTFKMQTSCISADFFYLQIKRWFGISEIRGVRKVLQKWNAHQLATFDVFSPLFLTLKAHFQNRISFVVGVPVNYLSFWKRI